MAEQSLTSGYVDDRFQAFIGAIKVKLPRREQNILSSLAVDEESKAKLTILVENMFADRISQDRCLYSIIHQVNTKSMDASYQIYSDIFRGVDTDVAKALAKKSVDALGLSSNVNTELVYGEIDFHSFASILERVNIPQGSLFVDLGHGTGKALCVARLLFGDRFSRIHGVEILEDLHLQSEQIVGALQEKLHEVGDDSDAIVTVCQGDMLTSETPSACVRGNYIDWGQAGLSNALIELFYHSRLSI